MGLTEHFLTVLETVNIAFSSDHSEIWNIIFVLFQISIHIEFSCDSCQLKDYQIVGKNSIHSRDGRGPPILLGGKNFRIMEVIL